MDLATFTMLLYSIVLVGQKIKMRRLPGDPQAGQWEVPYPLLLSMECIFHLPSPSQRLLQGYSLEIDMWC